MSEVMEVFRDLGASVMLVVLEVVVRRVSNVLPETGADGERVWGRGREGGRQAQRHRGRVGGSEAGRRQAGTPAL